MIRSWQVNRQLQPGAATIQQCAVQMRSSILLTSLFGKIVMLQQLAIVLKNAGQIIE